MARERDYHGEYERRKKRAQDKGYSSYWRHRKAKASKEQSEPPSKFEPAYKRAGFATPGEYRRMQAESRKWSKERSKNVRSEFLDNKDPETQRAYYNAFVLGKNPNRLMDMKYYLVVKMGFMSEAEFNAKYLKKGR